MSSGYINIPAYGSASWKSPVPTAVDLPPDGNALGDARVTQDTSTIYIWDGSSWVSSGTGGGGTVTSVALAAPADVFDVSGSPVTGAGTLTLSFDLQNANEIFAGPASGSPTAPTFRPLVVADIPALPYQPPGNYITALTGDASASGPGSVPITFATVNSNVGSFGLADSVSTFTVNGKGLITAAANLSIQIAESQVTNLVSDLAGKQPVGNYITALTGDATASGPGSAALTLATVNLNVGSFGSASSVATFTVNAKGLVTAASNISIQISEAQVTNLISDLAGKQNVLTIGDITDAGTDGIVITGGTGAIIGTGVSLAQHVADATHNGYLSSVDWSTFSGKGSVSSVALADSTGTFNITGSPVTSAGTLTLSSFASQSAKTFLAAPTGGAGAPSFRVIAAADVPTLNQNTTGTASNVTGIVALINGGTGTAAASANAAFNALSPMTASGDIIYGGTSGAGTRLAAGSNGQSLVLAAGIPSWSNSQGATTTNETFVGGQIVTTRTITTNLTLDTTTKDYIVFCNQSGSISITFPAPVNGRVFIIKDISGTAQTNTITMVRNGSEKIEGIAASKLLQTNWGSWTFTTNGTDWFMV